MCVGGNTARYPVQNSGGSGATDGVMSQANPVANSSGLITAAGETWNFQCWYRDPSFACVRKTNLSNGVEVLFTP